MARRFSTSQRAALWVHAEGKCALCGNELEDGWHADHIVPWSAGGETDVTNGQALCPTCNLKKGTRVDITLRDWQNEGLEAFEDWLKRGDIGADGRRKAFVCSACPGAGKTVFVFALFDELRGLGLVDKLLVITPTDAIRVNWADTTAFDINLCPAGNDPGDYKLKTGYNGWATTAQSVSTGAGPDLWRMRVDGRTLLIIDEGHHVADKKAWGDAIAGIQERVGYTVILTGTPFRHDGNKISFAEYDANNTIVVHYEYSLRRAIEDGVCKPTDFHVYDATGNAVRYDSVSEYVLQAKISDADVTDSERSMLKRSAIHHESEAVDVMLSDADQMLESLRRTVPDAAGLLVAAGTTHADLLATKLRQITSAPVEVVHSLISNDSVELIKRFRDGTAKWIVAVDQVSEGVDIPRLAVGIYVSDVESRSYLVQVFGRLWRLRPGEHHRAHVFMLALPSLVKYAYEIEEAQRHIIPEETVDEKEAAERTPGEMSDVEIRPAVDPTFEGTIVSGRTVPAADMQYWEEFCTSHGISIALASEMALHEKARSANTDLAPRLSGIRIAHTPYPKPVERHPEKMPLHRQDRELRQRIKRKISQVADQYRRDIDPTMEKGKVIRAINTYFVKFFDKPKKAWDNAELRQCLVKLDKTPIRELVEHNRRYA